MRSTWIPSVSGPAGRNGNAHSRCLPAGRSAWEHAPPTPVLPSLVTQQKPQRFRKPSAGVRDWQPTTVQERDHLTKIAKMHGISDWRIIYDCELLERAPGLSTMFASSSMDPLT